MVRKVGLRELKNRLSEYVRRVRAGDVLLVTDRGEVVAELRPPGEPPASPDIPPGLLALARRGSLTLGGPNHPGLYPRLRRLVPPGTAQQLLDEERNER
ncbi:MAG: type II toxin-antitoxin system prevent-host-death family antitoxin [Candidatus Rokubacteria bacterium]|nr:type II toxin-antitoxin system prevent-host-death family antitoxin [Candidatus Rokubacteria bacterium]